MDHKDQRKPDKQHNHSNHFSKENIPLWLQGLDEPENEISSLKSDTAQTNLNWEKEPSAIEDVIRSNQTTSEINETDVDPFLGQQNPDQFKADKTQDINSGNNYLNQDEYFSLQTEKRHPVDDEPTEQIFQHDDFSNLSEISHSSETNQVKELGSENNSTEDDLPQWLYEMIEEESQLTSQETAPSSLMVENEEVIEFSATNDLEVEIDEKLIEDVEEPYIQDEPTEPVIISQETLAEPVLNPEEISQSSEDAAPILIQSDSLAEMPLELPAILQSAKNLLDQGDFVQGLDIINTFIDQPEYILTIKLWLEEVSNGSGEDNNEIWELLGDIAMIENDPETAINAYTKAINFLLTQTEE